MLYKKYLFLAGFALFINGASADCPNCINSDEEIYIDCDQSKNCCMDKESNGCCNQTCSCGDSCECTDGECGDSNCCRYSSSSEDNSSLTGIRNEDVDYILTTLKDSIEKFEKLLKGEKRDLAIDGMQVYLDFYKRMLDIYFNLPEEAKTRLTESIKNVIDIAAHTANNEFMKNAESIMNFAKEMEPAAEELMTKIQKIETEINETATN